MPESADLCHVWPVYECWGMAVFWVTKPAGILGAGGLVHFVHGSPFWLRVRYSEIQFSLMFPVNELLAGVPAERGTRLQFYGLVDCLLLSMFGG